MKQESDGEYSIMLKLYQQNVTKDVKSAWEQEGVKMTALLLDDHVICEMPNWAWK